MSVGMQASGILSGDYFNQKELKNLTKGEISMKGSDIARLRERIQMEYEAVNRVLTDFTPTDRHY